MIVETIPVGPLQVNACIVGCPATRKALLVDAGSDGAVLLDAIERLGLELELLVATHGHFDHIGGNRQVLDATGVPFAMHEADVPLVGQATTQAALYGLSTDESPLPTRLLAEGDQVRVGELVFDVLHVPGHSPGSICLVGQGHAFVGDVLFAGSIGRTDLPGGSYETLVAGIRSKLLVLPDETVVHSGHGPDTTIGREKQVNPFIGG
ncbi:MAG: MBL fold metallo-hydrolase [Deltaproteobacteria bacterium]|nr:MAG: MBL fold metallo-hydrolase [Deltaproteobacteria bacterium]